MRALYAPNSTLFYLDPVYETPRPSNNTQPSTSGLPSSQTGSTAVTAQASPTNPTSQPSPAERVLKGYTFVGGGLGHGVGMSQTGAYHLGELGWSHDRILSFYYPGTQLQPLNPSIAFWREPEIAQK